MKKEARQNAILKIIAENEITTQDDLMKALANEDIVATQATISRDMRELKIVKGQNADGKSYYTHFKEEKNTSSKRLNQVIKDVVLEVDCVEFTNVIHTLPRNANVLAALLDELRPLNLLGTIAGYDTLVTYSKSVADAKELNNFFKECLH
ncbi:ArgR family transcriptional regulator [Ligilactobacillus equi]|uniref:arginine repressor n=1 Tax=Ligilactobacillus equi TaxID=137357 RepID=UPI002ED119AE